ncbi:MAG: TraB/GumN family protein [Steroidobacteraceae bacterium]
MAGSLRRARGLARGLGVLLLGGLSAAALAAPPAGGDGTIWVLHGRHNSVYVAGSMHLLRSGESQLPASYERAYASARRIVMEIDLDDLDPSAAASFTSTHAIYPEGQSLHATLGDARWERARAAFESAGLPVSALDRMEPWAASLLYSVTQMTRAGLDPTLGVEEQLVQRARGDHKPITGLETLEQQLALFDDLPMESQARLLELTLDENADLDAELANLGRAWRNGDAGGLEKLLLRDYREFPDLYESIVYRRNRAWVPQVEALLQGEEDVLVVVGALHLVGERGLIELLRRRGVRAERYRLH